MVYRRLRSNAPMTAINPTVLSSILLVLLCHITTSTSFVPGNYVAGRTSSLTRSALDSDDGDDDADLFDGLTRDLFGGDDGGGNNGYVNGYGNGDEEPLERLRRRVADAKSSFPPPSSPAPPSIDKSSLYDDDVLADLLSTHKSISDQIDASCEENDDVGDSAPSSSSSSSFSLHDLVAHAVADAPDDDDDASDTRATIRAIASDVDGTLLSGGTVLHPRTFAAVKRAVEDPDLVFFPATGKSRAGALASLGPEVTALFAKHRVPGVYAQGLYCVDGDGNVVFERRLPPAAVVAAEALAAEEGLSIVGYDGDDLYTTAAADGDGDGVASDIVRHLHEHYGEPAAVVVDSLAGRCRSADNGLHKILLLHDDVERLRSRVRPRLEALAADHDASVTVALPTMLELLPANCDKATGVRELCARALDVDPAAELLAIGDAENDARLLTMARIGVAVGNACPAARAAADAATEETAAEGAAGVAIERYAFGQQGDVDDDDEA